MMLPFRRRPNAPKSSPEKPAADTGSLKPDVPDLGPHHLDYDLHPLNVERLSHYIEPLLPIVENDRFHVH
jgi:hypothetical protein